MHHFAYQNGELHCERVALSTIADKVGTPCYVYSSATLRHHVKVLANAFTGQDYLIAYSVKANGNLAVLATLAAEGCGADVVSGGELQRALKAGISPEKIVFSGVGKTQAEMRLALEAGIHQFNVESAGELQALSSLASQMDKRAPIAMRVNPNIAAGGHANISTGKSGDKFGIPWHDAPGLYAHAAGLAGIDIVGVDIHIGSQIADLGPMQAAFEKTANLAKSLRGAGHAIHRIDVGGGLSIPYRSSDAPASPAAYAQMIANVMEGLDVQIILEPGRMITGNAGVMLSTILYEKQAPDRTFLILDAGMNDLMRPVLYEAYHDILPLYEPGAGAEERIYDIVGPICESTDKFAAARKLPPVMPGQPVAFMSAGAYGAVLASSYNARPLIAEVLVKDASYEVIRRRPGFDEMIELEQVPNWLISPA